MVGEGKRLYVTSDLMVNHGSFGGSPFDVELRKGKYIWNSPMKKQQNWRVTIFHTSVSCHKNKNGALHLTRA